MIDYGHQHASHVLDFYLWREVRAILADYHPHPTTWHNHPSRYADGEEEHEGLWR